MAYQRINSTNRANYTRLRRPVRADFTDRSATAARRYG